MVQPGQFLERPAVIQCGAEERVLEGLYHRGERDPVLFAPPHPLMGGSMENPVCNEVAYACYKANFPSLRFNFRGVGASQGEPSASLDDAAVDMTHALEFLLETCDSEGALVGGYSFGSMAAGRLLLSDPRAEMGILVAPPAAKLDCGFLAQIEKRLLVLVGGHDQFGPLSKVKPLFEGKEYVLVREIPEADHFYSAGLSELGRVLRAWLEGLRPE